ncbi:MAG TPA: A24 family peptidase [Terracidiphilus sp.]|nr:A24 family peptidase [Terracidiphilus sp.]
MKMHSIAWWPTVAVLAVATFTDLRSRRIPNWLVFPFLVAGLTVSVWMHGWRGLGMSLEGMGLGLLIFGTLFLMGGMGAGDVKLFAAIGAWIGPGQLMLALVVTGLAGGVMALGWAVWGGFVKELLKDTGDLMFGRAGRSEGETEKEDKAPVKRLRRKIPYAPAIAIGTLISFFAR